MNPEIFFIRPQYSIRAAEKQAMLLEYMTDLHSSHMEKCPEYSKIVSKIFSKKIETLNDLPFLPVSIFKNHQLKSIPESEVFKVLTSSGTTGNIPSKIYLDVKTAQSQTKALSNIMQSVLGKDRLPMLIADTIGLIKNRGTYSARGAGVLGMSVFGKSHTYLLNENMEVDTEALIRFQKTFAGSPKLIFGFTFMVWEYLFETSPPLDLSETILIHSGGWKKLAEKSVDNATFKKKLRDKFNITKVFNFYGMVEQIGSVFLECEEGYLHAPNFADVIIRAPYDFSPLEIGKEGIIQVLSILPGSYPGFSLLTEDMGTVHGEDNCKCGRKGKYFQVSGRMKKAELRGCSDTFTISN